MAKHVKAPSAPAMLLRAAFGKYRRLARTMAFRRLDDRGKTHRVVIALALPLNLVVIGALSAFQIAQRGGVVAQQSAAADAAEFIRRFSANQDLLVWSDRRGIDLEELIRAQLALRRPDRRTDHRPRT